MAKLRVWFWYHVMSRDSSQWHDILSTLGISSRGYAFGFAKRLYTNEEDVFFTYKLMINLLISWRRTHFPTILSRVQTSKIVESCLVNCWQNNVEVSNGGLVFGFSLFMRRGTIQQVSYRESKVNCILCSRILNGYNLDRILSFSSENGEDNCFSMFDFGRWITRGGTFYLWAL